MTFTYGNDPANSDRDAVRVLINDTSETSNSLSDETIAWLLEVHPNVWFAAAGACDQLAAVYASAVSEKQVGDLKIKTGAGDPSARYRSMAAAFRQSGGIQGFTPFSGGISVAGKDTELDDSDRLPDDAAIGMHDNYEWGGGSTSGRWDF